MAAKVTFSAALLSLLRAVQGDDAPEWEDAPFMNEPPFGFEANHCVGFTVRGKSFLNTGNLRIPEFDSCGESCMTREDFSDFYALYDPDIGYTDLSPHPTGDTRGYSIGDVMYSGTDQEVVFWGFGQTRYRDPETESFFSTPRWGYDDDGNYTLAPRSSYPRLDDMWTFDGSSWTKINATFPGVGRTHPALVAIDGKVYVGLGFGELCACPLHETCSNCEPRPGIEDPRGRSSNLQDMYVYDVASNEWSQIADFPYPAHHPYQFGLNGKAYVIGGHNGGVLYKNVHYYDDEKDTWVAVAPVPGPPRVAGSEFSYAGYGCIIAGEGDEGGTGDLDGFGNSETTNESKEHHRAFDEAGFYCYDAESDTWLELPSPPGLSRWVPTTFIRDDYLYYTQGPIRTGQGEDYKSDWPAQGYRINMDNVVRYMEETLSANSRDASFGSTTSAFSVCSNGMMGAVVGAFLLMMI